MFNMIIIFVLLEISLQFSNVASYSYEICQDISLSPIKYCNIRDDLYPKDLFLWVSGANCYIYSDNNRYKNQTKLKIRGGQFSYKDGRTYIIPYSLDIATNTPIFYDYGNKNSTKYIRESFISDNFFDKWFYCSQQAMLCCDSMDNKKICPSNEYSCPNTWDAWDCWPQTESGDIRQRDCPTYIIYTAEPPCIPQSEKMCFENGEWNKTTTYETCVYGDLIKNRHIYHVAVLSITAIISLPALIIFFVYPSLRITRVILHRNLLMSIFVKNIFVIMSKTLLTIHSLNDTTRIEENGVPCRLLVIFERIAINAMYSSMLIDGFYLHKAIVRVFDKSEPNMYILYGITTVLSVVPILAWSIVKVMQDDRYCWIVDETGWRQWIIDGSRYFILAVNTMFLIHILITLFSRFRDTLKNSSHHTKLTLKATLVLLPLFLIQFAMMSQKPSNISCIWDSVFYYFSYTMDSLQGMMVSLIYCYLNKEVQSLVKRSYQQFNFSRKRRKTVNTRKNTAATYVGESTIADREDNGNVVCNEETTQAKIQNWFCRNRKLSNENNVT